MPRPGCVWTHTLLIDFTDLAAVEMLTGFSDLFRRPSSLSAAQDYGKPTLFSASAQYSLPSVAENWARQV